MPSAPPLPHLFMEACSNLSVCPSLCFFVSRRQCVCSFRSYLSHNFVTNFWTSARYLQTCEPPQGHELKGQGHTSGIGIWNIPMKKSCWY